MELLQVERVSHMVAMEENETMPTADHPASEHNVFKVYTRQVKLTLGGLGQSLGAVPCVVVQNLCTCSTYPPGLVA